MTAPALAELIRCAEDAGIAVISDEIYHGLDYAFAAESAARLSSDAIIINSFSKYFCMTGWRIGWMVVPPALVRAVERLQQNLAISVPTLVADRGRSRVRRPRRAGTDQARLRGKSPHPGRGIAARGTRLRSCRPTARSISMPTSRASRPTVSISPRACSRKPALRRRRASISIRCTAGISCACATPARARTCAKRSSGSALG